MPGSELTFRGSHCTGRYEENWCFSAASKALLLSPVCNNMKWPISLEQSQQHVQASSINDNDQKWHSLSLCTCMVLERAIKICGHTPTRSFAGHQSVQGYHLLNLSKCIHPIMKPSLFSPTHEWPFGMIHPQSLSIFNITLVFEALPNWTFPGTWHFHLICHLCVCSPYRTQQFCFCSCGVNMGP